MVTALVIGVAVALLVAAGWWIAQPKLTEDVRDPEEHLPLFSARLEDGSRASRQQPSIEPAEVAMLRRGARRRAAPLPAPGEPRLAAELDAPDSLLFGDRRGVSRTPTAPRDLVRAEVPPQDYSAGAAAARALGDGQGAVRAERSTIVPVPAGTVQFLPGRLEVLQGRGVAGQELRFIRPENSSELPAVTFGRGEGPPYRHVQLRAPTVSRLHGRIVLQDGGVWTLENLSTTNPIILNGVELANGSLPEPLADGDRIEMGEIVFRYRQR